MDTISFTPPETLDVVRDGGFTVLTTAGTLWRPASVARRGTRGTLVAGSVFRDDFYQTEEPVVSARYRLPGYSYRVKVWWHPDGQRIA